jgi:hypothetical protein
MTPGHETRFWRWFETNSARIFDFENDQERVFDDLAVELRRVHRDLTFEFGPIADGRREFILSAGGIRAAFPAVLSLSASAPALAPWQIVAFRPPKSLDLTLVIADLSLGADDLWFEAFQDDDNIAIALYLRGYTESRDELFSQAAFILLDCALGEYTVGTRVGAVELRPLPEDPESADLYPFTSIRDFFDTTEH